MISRFHKSYIPNVVVSRGNVYEILVGSTISMFWPLFLSVGMLSPWYGWIGVMFGLAMSGLMVVCLYYFVPFIFICIARGSWIYGLLCGFPIIPLFLGLFIIELVNVFNPGSGTSEVLNEKLSFNISFFATIIYSFISVIASFIIALFLKVAKFIFNPEIRPTS